MPLDTYSNLDRNKIVLATCLIDSKTDIECDYDGKIWKKKYLDEYEKTAYQLSLYFLYTINIVCIYVNTVLT